MKEIVVISGKGGTGKTSIVAGLASIAENKIMVDCDVDASDLHLILNPEVKEKTLFYSGFKAEIDTEICIKCYKCKSLCRFDAVSDDLIIKELNCEGCGVCVEFCPVKAIKTKPSVSGEWYVSDTRFGTMVHAQLYVAEENSGKLVTAIRTKAAELAKRNKTELIIIDGPPGTGCPVIASITGARHVLIVAEPTLSSIHDVKRVFELTRQLKVPTSICINKYDINIELSEKIQEFCQNNNIDQIGRLPYDNAFTEAQIKGLSVIELLQNHITDEIKSIWNDLYIKIM